jgi:UDP-glucuronate 4-epimerase
MKILVTGVAGFIGTNIALHLLKKNNFIFGIDNFDNYNSIKLKKFRLKELKKNKKFSFKKIDILDKKKLFNYIYLHKIDAIIHLAGQAGVRYSFLNPSKYIDSNIAGFMNVVLAAKKHKVKKIIYASSSSVYGDNKTFPSNEKDELKQKNIYAVTKMLNEKIAEMYSKISNIKFIGLRFFTIYGEYGRPDMFLFKLFKASFTKESFELNNYGNHMRDFTYVQDVNLIVERLIKINSSKNIIINVCSNSPVNILKIVKKFTDKIHVKVKYVKKHKADILKTHGNNSKIKRLVKYKKFYKFNEKLFFIYDWYKKNKIYKL